MKRLLLIALGIAFVVNLLPSGSSHAQTMEDYCVVPPYVIQDVPPNVMIVLDNSGSMFNLAYACTKTNTSAAGNNTTVIPVNDVTGFKARQWIVVGASGDRRQIAANGINTSNNTITVTASVSFSLGASVMDYGCYGTNFYDDDYTCAQTTTSAAGTSVTTIPVSSTSNFWVGQIIAIASAGGPHERVITGITTPPDPPRIIVNTPVTFANNSSIYDYNCYYLRRPWPEQSFSPNKQYYGYFLSTYWYTYDSSGGRFVTSRLKSAGAKTSTEWDGNFLNWLTMRRADVLNKVMTGGKTTTNNRLVTRNADSHNRGIYKAVYNAENYMGCTGCTGTINVTLSTGSSNPSSFTAYSGPAAPGSWTNRGSYSLHVVVPSSMVPVTGVLQETAGTRARLGLTFYNAPASGNPGDGGYVQVNVAAANLASAVEQINNMNPRTNTPLGETLWTVGGYFAQQSSISAVGSPGPRYYSGDYQISNNVDPLNFGTGGSPRFPYCAKNYVLYITDGEPCADGNVPGTFATYASTRTAFRCSGSSCPAYPSGCTEGVDCLFNSATLPSCSAGGNVSALENVALYLHTNDLRNNGGSPNIGKDNLTGIQNLNLFMVFAFGRGSTLLQYASINGGFEDINGNNQPDLQSEWDNNNDGVPDNYYEADEGQELENAIRDALSSILKRAASGTAASVLASGEGSGANLIQAVFYPRRQFGNHVITWTGEKHNFWYYVDPFFENSSIREDTVTDSILNLANDYITTLYFDTIAQQTKARRYHDTDGDGDADAVINPPIPFENLSTLWKGGMSLWSRDITTDPRIIYTTINGTSFLANRFSVSNRAVLRPYLNVSDDNLAEDVIRYIHGEGLTTLWDEDGDVIVAGIDRDGDGIDDYRTRYATIGTQTHVWKLGDVLNSTPRISSWIPLNNYDTKYYDTTYAEFIGTPGYKSRGMVFAGANDGMLHALKLGSLSFNWTGQLEEEIARLSGTDLGREMWAFIPRNALPYLKYIMNPEYCHIYSVDLSPYIFDASINGDATDDKTVNSWRTILIGGMRLGGASRGSGVACADVSGDGQKDCVNAPVVVGGSSVGLSSYFALDVTDQNNPQFLWEFTHPQLGFASTGPALVRIGDKSKNGNWFVVFGSGPTGPINTTELQFMGSSDQDFRLFVVDVKTGNLVRIIDTGMQYAFGGSMINTTLDADLDYTDDAVYVSYTKRTTSSPYTWTNGGIGRIFTKGDPDPDKWVWRTLRDGMGSVTSSITKLQSNRKHNLWLFFGTGRYYFEIGTDVDDPTNQRTLFGIKEPCFNTSNVLDPMQAGDCQNVASGITGLTNVTSIGSIPTEATANSSAFRGWYINLDLSGTFTYCEVYNANGSCAQTRTQPFRAERVITDPLASTTGLVFFTTYKPYNDECGLGGKSFIWAVRYTTGGPGGALLKGMALLQVSTGSIEQLNLSEAFTEAGGRKTAALEGVPPTAQGLSLLTTPPPVKRVIHMRER